MPVFDKCKNTSLGMDKSVQHIFSVIRNGVSTRIFGMLQNYQKYTFICKGKDHYKRERSEVANLCSRVGTSPASAERLSASLSNT